MTLSLLSYFACGLSAGLLGGYLGLGGGVVTIPYLTLISGIELKAAVPLSVTAIVVNSISASTEYIKRGMVNFELMVSLGIFMTLGNVAGSIFGAPMPESVLQFLFGLTLLYTAYAFMRKPDPGNASGQTVDHKYYCLCLAAAFATGALGAMIGVGGGVIIIPLMFVVFGLPLATARGTSSFLIGASSAAAVAVYFFSNRIDLGIAPPLLVGTIVGGKAGGYLGTAAKPKAVKLVFLALMLYLAARFIYTAVATWTQ